jgi:putative DNA primase/helicase
MTERPAIHIRVLGKSEAPECEWRGVVFGTGNNITFFGDMTRRGLVANLDPKCERPELRTFGFDPVERVLDNRGAYIAAAITITRAYIAAGCPNVCKTPLGSYAGWSRMVRSPLVWLGGADPVNSMDELRQEDPERRALGWPHLRARTQGAGRPTIRSANQSTPRAESCRRYGGNSLLVG